MNSRIRVLQEQLVCLYPAAFSRPPPKHNKGKLSTKGLGRTAPDPTQQISLPNGTIVPLGKGKNTGISDTSLQYNECECRGCRSGGRV